MKTSKFGIVVAAVAGLLLGYLLFSDNSSKISATNHTHFESISDTWTCSMHPQIMLPDPGKCPICGMDLIRAQMSGSGLLPGQFELTEEAMALADIQTTSVVRKAAGLEFQRLSGTLRANETTTATQAAYFDGRLEQLFVFSKGEDVKKGQLIAKIYAPDLVSAQQELLSVSRMKTAQPQLYEAVRTKLKYWKLSDAQITSIEDSGKVLEYFPVYAAVAGTLSEISVAAGDYVKKGQALFRVANLNSLWAEFDAYEAQFAKLKLGTPITIEFQGQPQLELKGQVTYISPMLNAAARTAVVRVEVPNTNNQLKLGMFVQGWFSGESADGKEELFVPESAVLWTGTRSVVYMRSNTAAATFELREITLGSRSEEGYQVLSGLEEGELVVTNGTFTVDAAAQLNGKRSMMSAVTDAGSDSELASFLNEILQQYLPIKDALVASDSLRVSKAALAGLNVLRAVPQLANADDLLASFSNLSNTPELLGQREHFRKLSELVIQAGTTGNNLEQTLYIQYCPMANNNLGATWISQFNDIKNPYFGNAMLSCGETRSTWGPN